MSFCDLVVKTFLTATSYVVCWLSKNPAAAHTYSKAVRRDGRKVGCSFTSPLEAYCTFSTPMDGVGNNCVSVQVWLSVKPNPQYSLQNKSLLQTP